MLRATLLIAFLAFLTGCATQGQLSTLPKVENTATACDVYVIRKSSIIGAGLGYTVGIDHQDLAAITSGKYVQIKVDHGPHVLTVKYPRQAFLGTAESSMEFDCTPNRNVYILIWPGLAVKMKELSADKGAEMVRKSKRIDLR